MTAHQHTGPVAAGSPADGGAADGGLADARPVIAFLGIGRMGDPMAANLATAGFPVRTWNRTPSRATAAAGTGATIAASPAAAVDGADIVITMLADGAATQSVLSGPDGFADASPAGGGAPLSWAQMGTIGLDWTTRLADTAALHGITYVDAPVSGSQAPAEAGELIILASGPDEARGPLTPVFDVLGRSTLWLGEAGAGTKAKLVLNSWLADLTEATAESLAFARRLGLDPRAVVDLLQATPLGSAYALQKAEVMLAGDFEPSFALKHALKDAELAVQAAQSTGTQLGLTSALIPRWRETAEAGHGDEDLAAVYTTA